MEQVPENTIRRGRLLVRGRLGYPVRNPSPMDTADPADGILPGGRLGRVRPFGSPSSAWGTTCASPTNGCRTSRSLFRSAGSRVAWMKILPVGILTPKPVVAKLQPIPKTTSASSRNRRTSSVVAFPLHQGPAGDPRRMRSFPPTWWSPARSTTPPTPAVPTKAWASEPPARR